MQSTHSGWMIARTELSLTLSSRLLLSLPIQSLVSLQVQSVDSEWMSKKSSALASTQTYYQFSLLRFQKKLLVLPLLLDQVEILASVSLPPSRLYSFLLKIMAACRFLATRLKQMLMEDHIMSCTMDQLIPLCLPITSKVLLREQPTFSESMQGTWKGTRQLVEP